MTDAIIDAYSAAENYDRTGNWSGWGYLHGESIGMAVRGPGKVRIWLARDTSKETTIQIRKGVGPVTFEDKVHAWVKKHAGGRGGRRDSLLDAEFVDRASNMDPERGIGWSDLESDL